MRKLDEAGKAHDAKVRAKSQVRVDNASSATAAAAGAASSSSSSFLMNMVHEDMRKRFAEFANMTQQQFAGIPSQQQQLDALRLLCMINPSNLANLSTNLAPAVQPAVPTEQQSRGFETPTVPLCRTVRTPTDKSVWGVLQRSLQ